MTIPHIEDRIAVYELKARYCRFLDTKQWDAWAALFTEDFVLDTSEAGGGAPIEGRDAVVAMVRGAIETVRTAHQIHTPEIAIDGDSATAIWAMQDRLVFHDRNGMAGYGHYTERYAKHDGTWLIASSKLARWLIDMTAAPA